MAIEKRHKAVRKVDEKMLARLAKRVVCLHFYTVCCMAIAISLFSFFCFPSQACAGLKRPKRHVAESASYNGIDVSKYQGVIDWNTVAKDRRIQFVYIKATEGSGMVDRMYRRNIDGAKKAGLRVGSYHFFTSRSTPEAQFNNYCRHVNINEQDLIPMVDVEESGVPDWGRAELQRNLSVFMNLVKQKFGKYPLLYSPHKFYNDLLAPEFNKYYLFIARFGKQRPFLLGNGKYNIWQYSETGSVNGIVGPVDLSCFTNGTTIHSILYRR